MKSKPIGLVNMGNTCYFNSVNQCISSTKYLQKLYDREDFDFGNLNTQYGKLLKGLRKNANQSLAPKGIHGYIARCAPRFKVGSQEDAHDLMLTLLDKLMDEQNKKGEESEIEKTYGGLMTSSVLCKTCLGVSRTVEPMMDLMIDIKFKNASKASGTGNWNSRMYRGRKKKMNRKQKARQKKIEEQRRKQREEQL